MQTIPFILACSVLLFAFAMPEDDKAPKITGLKFGTIKVNGKTYEKDIIIDKGKVSERKKGPSRPQREEYGHTPLTPLEAIPWDCKKLVVGIGMSSRLPVTKAFKEEAKKRGVELVLLETPEAVEYFTKNYGPEVNAIFHITC